MQWVATLFILIKLCEFVKKVTGCIWSHWTKGWKQLFIYQLQSSNMETFVESLNDVFSKKWKCPPASFPKLWFNWLFRTDVLNDDCSFERRAKVKGDDYMGMLQVYTTSTKPPITLTETHVCNITLNTKQANNLIAVKVCITEKSQIIE